MAYKLEKNIKTEIMTRWSSVTPGIHNSNPKKKVEKDTPKLTNSSTSARSSMYGLAWMCSAKAMTTINKPACACARERVDGWEDDRERERERERKRKRERERERERKRERERERE